MAIPTSCPRCATFYRVKDQYAGQRIRCKNCRQEFVVPAPVQGPPAMVEVVEVVEAEVVSPPPIPDMAKLGQSRGHRPGKIPIGEATFLPRSAVLWLGLVAAVVLAVAIGVTAAWFLQPANQSASDRAQERPTKTEPMPSPDAPKFATTVEDLKSATVFIKVASGSTRITGSGFLVGLEGQTGYIITNTHVIGLKGAGGVRGRQMANAGVALPAPQISIIFWSGTRQEHSSPAQVVAADTDQDLALLQVNQTADLPKPIDTSSAPHLQETLPVVVYGFPFGEALSLDKSNPAITVGRGSISSIRRNQWDEPIAIQIDGAFNPGNSGGPVLDSDGRLVGVAAATIRGSGIGLAIPGRAVMRMVDGRVGAITSIRQAGAVSSTSVPFEVSAALQDPLRRIRSAVLHYRVTGVREGFLPPDKEGNWAQIAGSHQLALRIADSRLEGTFGISPSDRNNAFTFQIVYVDGAGRQRFARPESLTLPQDGAVVQTTPNPNVPTPNKPAGQPFPTNKPPIVAGTIPQLPPVHPAAPPPNQPPVTARPAQPIPPVAVQPQLPTQLKGEVALPAAVREVVVGGGGRYLILDLASLRQLAVFDVKTGRIAKYLPVAEDAIHFAAGANRLAVLYPNAKLIQIWNLDTFEKERTSHLPAALIGDDIHQICMGSGSPGPLFVYLPREKRTLALDLTRLTTTEVNWNHWSPSNAYGPLHMRVSPDGTMLLGWAGGWAGMDMAIFDNGKQVGAYDKFEFSLGVFALPSADARLIFTPWAIVGRDFTAKKIAGLTGKAYLVPAHEPGYFLALHSGAAALPGSPFGKKAPPNLPAVSHVGFYSDDGQLLVTANDIDELKELSALYWEQRVHYYPRTGLLVTLAKEATSDRVLLRRVDLVEMLNKAGVDYLFVASKSPGATKGATFSYRLDIRSKKGSPRVKLEYGPTGMQVTPEGQVTWAVPQDFSERRADVLLTITDASGQEVFHNFKVVLTGT